MHIRDIFAARRPTFSFEFFPPKTEEMESCLGFLKREGVNLARTRQQLVAVLLNHNDFVTIR